MFNRETHKSRGFGFVVYEHETSAEAACAVEEHVIDGRVVSACLIIYSVYSVLYSIYATGRGETGDTKI